MKLLLDLFLTFFRVGALTFGGGYAMLPLLEKEVVDRKHWATEEEILDYYAIGQCTPGLIAVNTSTFIGNKLRGPLGGFCATMGFISPGMIVITLVATVMQNFMDQPIVVNAFAGIQVCVFVLILNACIKMGKTALKNAFSVGLYLLVLAASVIFSISPIWIVLFCGAAGLVQGYIVSRKAGGDR